MAKTFEDFDVALRMRDLIESIVEIRLKSLSPADRTAKVVTINREARTAEVQLSGDEGLLTVKFPPSLQPRTEGSMVRVAGKPGNYFITSVLSEAAVHEVYEQTDQKADDALSSIQIIDQSIVTIQQEADAFQISLDAIPNLIDQKNSELSLTVNDALAEFENVTMPSQIDNKIDTFMSDTVQPAITESANGKNRVWRQDAKPPMIGNTLNDTWFDTDDGHKMYQWNGADWTASLLGHQSIASLDLGKATVGELDGIRIKARSIGVESLVVGIGANLISNPSAERAVDRVAFPANGVLAYQASSTTGYGLAKSGGWMFRLNTVPVGYDYKQFAADIPVLPGEHYRVSYWSKRWYTNAPVGVSFRALDAAGTPGDWNVGLLSTSAADAMATWVYRSQIFQVPDGIFGLRPYLTTRGGGGQDVWFIDDVSLTRAASGELIVDGSITGDKVLANSIGVEKLLVADLTNYIADPYLNGIPGGWTFTASNAYIGTFGGPDGRPGTLIMGPGAYVEARSNTWSVKPGEKFQFTIDVLRQASADGSWLARAQFLDSAGEHVTYIDAFAGDASNTASSWATRTVEVVTPSNTNIYSCRIQMIRVSPYTTGFWIFDNFYVRRKFGGELIVDGAVQAQHFNGTTFTGVSITGALLQTSSQANRGVKITDWGLFGYSPADGSALTKLDSLNGRLTAVGGFSTGTGFGDVTIRPGNSALDPSALEFWPVRSGIDISDGKRPSLSVYTENSLLTGGYDAAMLRVQAPMGVNNTTRARIDLYTERSPGTSNRPLNSHILYHAGAQFGGAGGKHIFYIDGAPKGSIDSAGIHANNMFPSTEQPVYVRTDGLLKLQGSSERVKTEIESLSLGVVKRFLKVDGVSYRYIEGYDPGDKIRRTRAGMIVERLIEQDLDMWAFYDSDGKPSGIDYPAISAAHNVLHQDTYKWRDEMTAWRKSVDAQLKEMKGKK